MANPDPKAMTAGQQIVMTIKLILAAAVVLGVIWFLDRGV
jgi:hypothetical protein